MIIFMTLLTVIIIYLVVLAVGEWGVMKDIEYQEVEDYVIQLKNNNVKVIEYKHFKDKFNFIDN